MTYPIAKGLVINSRLASAMITKITLSEWGYQVDTDYSIKSAERDSKISGNNYDFVLIESNFVDEEILNLPLMLRSLANNNDLPVFFRTSRSNNELELMTLENGYDLHCVKNTVTDISKEMLDEFVAFSNSKDEGSSN